MEAKLHVWPISFSPACEVVTKWMEYFLRINQKTRTPKLSSLYSRELWVARFNVATAVRFCGSQRSLTSIKIDFLDKKKEPRTYAEKL